MTDAIDQELAGRTISDELRAAAASCVRRAAARGAWDCAELLAMLGLEER